jgi:hypothetical protein
MYFQTIQRLADSWRNIIGSTGIAVVMGFFDSRPEYQTDKQRIKFANFYHEGYRFLYEDSENEEKKVCDPKHDRKRLTITNLIRNGRGCFVVPLSFKLLLLILPLSRVP